MSQETQISTNELLRKLTETFEKTASKLKEEIYEKIQIENYKLFKYIKEQNTKLEILENKYSDLSETVKNIDRKLRKNNVLIFGLNVKKTQVINFEETVLNTINNLLSTDFKLAEINNIYPVKTEKGNPIKVEFISYLRKQEIFKNVDKLKGKHIFVANDLSFEDRQDRKILVEHLKEAKIKKYSAKIVNNKLVINGEIYSAQQLKGVTEDQIPPYVPQLNQTPISTPTTPIQLRESHNFDFDVNQKSPKVFTRREILSPKNPPLKRHKITEQDSYSIPQLRSRLNSKNKNDMSEMKI